MSSPSSNPAKAEALKALRPGWHQHGQHHVDTARRAEIRPVVDGWSGACSRRLISRSCREKRVDGAAAWTVDAQIRCERGKRRRPFGGENERGGENSYHVCRDGFIRNLHSPEALPSCQKCVAVGNKAGRRFLKRQIFRNALGCLLPRFRRSPAHHGDETVGSTETTA